VSASFKHVDPKLRGLVEADSSARIQMIEKDLFIEHDMSRFLNSQLDALMAEPRHSRMPCLLITGDAGMGKTAQLRRFQRRYPDGCGAGIPSVDVPLSLLILHRSRHARRSNWHSWRLSRRPALRAVAQSIGWLSSVDYSRHTKPAG
jgi:hypothetical protein